MSIMIAPSILSADVTRLGDEVEAVINAGADLIHFDVMDNHYVPNLTFGPMVCKALHQRFPAAIMDVHLMTTPTEPLIDSFAKAGAKRIAIHADADLHLDRCLQRITEKQCQAGLALNPADPIDNIEWVAHRLDYLLVMTVNPGFGGQSFISPLLKKIQALHRRYPDLPICVDGGVCKNNIKTIAEAGARQFVAGSAIFNSSDYCKTIKELRAAAMPNAGE